MSVKELPASERPRERLVRVGAGNLSNRELVAILLNSGFGGESVFEISARLLAKFNGRLRPLFNADAGELSSIRGIGTAKACQLAAVGELVKRLESTEWGDDVSSPRDAALFLMPRMRSLDRERLVALCLDAKNGLIGGSEAVISIGSLDSSPVRPREVFRTALMKNSAKVILAHNHPSGDPEPSESDISATQRIASVGQELGIPLLDHLIIGSGRYVSMKERDLF